MKLNELQGKKILFAGFGTESRSAIAFFRDHNIAFDFGIADDHENKSGFSNQERYDIAIRSPSIDAGRLTIPYTTVTNLFFGNTKCITIGITGTKGKSTTSTLTYTVLKENDMKVHLGGNIGRSLLDILSAEREGDYCVCELSSYQLEDIKYSPHISVFLNIFPEHMDHHGSADAYWNAKSKIAAFAGSEDFFIYNPDYPQLTSLALTLQCKTLPFIGALPFADRDIPLLGKHNRDNIRAVCTVGNLLGIPIDIIEKAVKSFRPLHHRLEKIGTFQGITFYDDAISTTPQSTICAIEALKNIDTIFLGGLDRGYDFEPLSKSIIQSGIQNIILFPASGKAIRQILKKHGYHGNMFETDNMKDAVAWAYAHTRSGYISLLSCASPSYSLWKNFEEKGDLFQKEVISQGKNV